MSEVQHSNFESIRKRLESRRHELVQRKHRVGRDLTHRDHALSPDLAEQAVELQNDETLQAIEAATSVELLEIDEALERMALGEYGVCHDCGQPIASLRLASLPQAVTCSACAR